MFAAIFLLVAAPISQSAPVATPTVTPPRSPRPLQSYFSPDDYPAAARGTRPQTTVGVALDINSEGRVAGCRIIQSSGSAILDRTTCQILARRARLTPARNTITGQATTGNIVDLIRWQQFPARN